MCGRRAKLIRRAVAGATQGRSPEFTRLIYRRAKRAHTRQRRG